MRDWREQNRTNKQEGRKEKLPIEFSIPIDFASLPSLI
jgi:hypothetical protein